MAKYYGTYSCGHEGCVNIIGPIKDREWKKERAFEKMCPECYEKYLEEQRQKANEESVKKAKEMELPELQGTEKQIARANTIRQKFIELFDKIDEDYLEMAREKYHKLEKVNLENILTIQDYMLTNKIEARWFIDNRDTLFKAIDEIVKDALKTDEEKLEEKLDEKQIANLKLESTVFPENAITNVAAEVTVKGNKIRVIFEKNDKFREIVKGLRYKWNGAWERELSEFTGAAEHRASELGNKLLNAGFPIMILDENIREKAVTGAYEQECDRWIQLRIQGDYEGWLAIRWYDKSDLYNKARKLPGSKWSNPSVVVRIEHYKEVQEFAELYSFKFSKKALEAIEEYKCQLENATIVSPATVEKEKPRDGLKEILNSGSEILDDLKD